MDSESASETLARSVRPGVVADLYGFRRSWSVVRDNRESEKTFARVGDGWVPDYVLLLNANEAEPKDRFNGVIYKVTETELKRLEDREKRYRPVEVTERLSYRQGSCESGDKPLFTDVYTFTGKQDHLIDLPPPNSCVLESYMGAVHRGFEKLGSRELEIFHQTTDNHRAQVIRAEQKSGDGDEGLPREW